MTLPALPGDWVVDDEPTAQELNDLKANVAEAVEEMHTHLAGYFELGTAFTFTSSTVIDMGMSLAVNLRAGQIVKLSFCSQMNYGAQADTWDANTCVLEFHEGATNIGPGKEILWNTGDTGGPGQETVYGECLFTVSSTGSHTYKMQAKRTSGSKSFTALIGAVFKVETLT